MTEKQKDEKKKEAAEAEVSQAMFKGKQASDAKSAGPDLPELQHSIEFAHLLHMIMMITLWLTTLALASSHCSFLAPMS